MYALEKLAQKLHWLCPKSPRVPAAAQADRHSYLCGQCTGSVEGPFGLCLPPGLLSIVLVQVG